jgi:hypothetical protein
LVVQTVFKDLKRTVGRSIELKPEWKLEQTLKRGDVRVVSVHTYEDVFPEALSWFVQFGVLPERRTILLCREQTQWEDVLLLLLRWRLSKGLPEGEGLFCIANAELLHHTLQVRCVSFVQECLSLQCPPLVFVSGPSKTSFLLSQFANRRIPSHKVDIEILQEVLKNSQREKIQTYMSEFAGAGKSFEIKKSTATVSYDRDVSKRMYLRIPAASISHFLTLFSRRTDVILLDSDAGFCLHVDVAETVGVEFNSYLFEIMFLEGFADLSRGTVAFFPSDRTALAIELPSGSLKKHMVAGHLCPQISVEARADTFCAKRRDLRVGMGKYLFYGRRYDGTAMRKRKERIHPANAFDRLQYVVLALKILKERNGRFPYVIPSIIPEPSSDFSALRHSIVDPSDNPNPNYLISSVLTMSCEEDSTVEVTDGPECFSFLVEASQMPVSRVSLWCLWNFVNVVYWQLRDMHYPESPLNMICMPIEASPGQKLSLKETLDAKESAKGQIINFILRTAREFATRQTKKSLEGANVYLKMEGFTSSNLNANFKKHTFTNEGYPVYSRTVQKGSKATTYYVYFRTQKNQWVVDDTITSTGPYFCASATPELHGVWNVPVSWTISPIIKVIPVSRKDGYNGEAIMVSGFQNENNNGVFLRQPPYDDVNGKPQYIKDLEGVARRHLFFNQHDSKWYICPTCTLEEGAFGKGDLSKEWWEKPPMKKDNVKATIIETDIPLVEVPEEDNNLDDEEVDYEQALRNERFREYLELEALFANTLRWQDSNHECLLFSNVNHVVSFLSMDPKKMREEMHPNLLGYLEFNKVDVGESLDVLTEKHYQVLSALTEVYRSQDEAKKLLGGSYCLTGDNLLKMLAIFIRLRVGIPVVLMGECGCGKTALLKYLCAWLDVDLMVLDVHGGTTVQDILEIFQRAETKRETTKRGVYVFLDEVNACNHMGLICEVVTKRSLQGKQLHDDVHILCALNPYRRRAKSQGETFGLVYKHSQKEGAPVDDMASLVYRVTAIPNSLRDFVFDFGALQTAQERMYISSMVTSTLKLPPIPEVDHASKERLTKARVADLEIITTLVTQAQTFVRRQEGDESAVSLRDVRRFLEFVNFFMDLWREEALSFVNATIVSLAFVYYYRLSREEHRASFWKEPL